MVSKRQLRRLEADKSRIESEITVWKSKYGCTPNQSQNFRNRTWKIPGSPRLFFAGDAFGSPHIEGAAFPGLATTERLLKKE